MTLADPAWLLHIDGTTEAPLPPGAIAFRARAAELIGSGAVEAGLELFVDSVGIPGIWRKSPSAIRQVAIDNAATLPKQFRNPCRPTRASRRLN